jgi:hypothetical protein
MAFCLQRDVGLGVKNKASGTSLVTKIESIRPERGQTGRHWQGFGRQRDGTRLFMRKTS